MKCVFRLYRKGKLMSQDSVDMDTIIAKLQEAVRAVEAVKPAAQKAVETAETAATKASTAANDASMAARTSNIAAEAAADRFAERIRASLPDIAKAAAMQAIEEKASAAVQNAATEAVNRMVQTAAERAATNVIERTLENQTWKYIFPTMFGLVLLIVLSGVGAYLIVTNSITNVMDHSNAQRNAELQTLLNKFSQPGQISNSGTPAK
jgi:hypothetical protein